MKIFQYRIVLLFGNHSLDALTTQTKEMNKHVIQFPLFVSSKLRYQVEI